MELNPEIRKRVRPKVTDPNGWVLPGFLNFLAKKGIITPYEYLLLMVIEHYCFNYGICWLSNKSLARETGLAETSISTIKKSTAKLLKLKLLVRGEKLIYRRDTYPRRTFETAIYDMEIVAKKLGYLHPQKIWSAPGRGGGRGVAAGEAGGWPRGRPENNNNKNKNKNNMSSPPRGSDDIEGSPFLNGDVHELIPVDDNITTSPMFNKSDLRRAEELRQFAILHMYTKLQSVDKWAGEFAKLRKELHLQNSEMKKVLDWYISSYDTAKFPLKIFSASKFRERYGEIIDSMKRNSSPDDEEQQTEGEWVYK